MPKRRLTIRQIERIESLQERRRQRLGAGLEALLAETAETSIPESGRVVVRHGASLAVEDAEGDIIHCVSRQNIGHPVCGDQVVWHRTASDRGVVTAILPRQTLLSRPDYAGRDKPLAANLTRLIILIAPAPAPSDYLVDQYLLAAETMGVAAMLVANKCDLLGDAAQREQFNAGFAHYPAIGYPLIWTSLREPATLLDLASALRDQTSILVGQSGVGKSSLVQALLPDREIQIGRLSSATGLGRHTTSAATWYRLPGGGSLIDSPGVRSFRIGAMAPATLAWGFREFRPYLGRCRFADCHHDQEPECALREAVAAGRIAAQRLANFRHLLAELTQARR
ncbi:MAG: ribosome small subunit-dependent GTPase A [Sphingobacteriia bacterium]|nr:ribosome small subunit-dependent GTPase A [Sphingobacteriia bacterium]NCC37972.1 ribosome small subunit-dependent GTPase A [Gammaproteobacteria bacterium]